MVKDDIIDDANVAVEETSTEEEEDEIERRGKN